MVASSTPSVSNPQPLEAPEDMLPFKEATACLLPQEKPALKALPQVLLGVLDECLPELFYVLDITVGQQKKLPKLTLYVDYKGTPAITLDACGQLHRSLAFWLEHPVHHTWWPFEDYALEVSSPGIFRQLSTPREWAFYEGSLVTLKQKRRPPQVDAVVAAEKGTLCGVDSSGTHAVVSFNTAEAPVVLDASVFGPVILTLDPVLKFDAPLSDISL
ncbi:MAG: ribosome maturation factor RimP [Vampirovibrionales bacterium]